MTLDRHTKIAIGRQVHLCRKISGVSNWKTGTVRLLKEDDLSNIPEEFETKIELGFDSKGRLVHVRQDDSTVKGANGVKIVQTREYKIKIGNWIKLESQLVNDEAMSRVMNSAPPYDHENEQ